MKGEVKYHLGRSTKGKWSVFLFVNELNSRQEAEELGPIVEEFVKDHIRHGLHIANPDSKFLGPNTRH
jgi:hypothetical protein